MKIFLTGFMGVGKTTIGKELAEHLNVEFFDLDDEICQTSGMSIPDFFDRFGEQRFRALEVKVLTDLLKRTPERCVIALGGGTMCYNDMHVELPRTGICVHLKMDWKELRERIKDLPDRPLAQQYNTLELHRLYLKRLPFYNCAQLETLVNTGFSAQKLMFLLKLLTNR